MDAVDKVMQPVMVLFVVVTSATMAFLFFRLALHVARPDWRGKRRRLADSDVLSQAEVTELFARARAPLNSFFRLLAVGFISVWALFIAGLAVDMLLLASPYPHLAVSSPLQLGQEIIIEVLFTAPVVLGLWPVFKARSIQASQEIERLFHQANNIPERDNSDLVSALRPGASAAGLRWFGVALIIMGLFLSFRHWPSGLPGISELQQVVLSLIGNMRNGA